MKVSRGWGEKTPYKRTLGGTQVGWMGEMSVPIISASGNSSPKSLRLIDKIYISYLDHILFLHWANYWWRNKK